MSGVATDNQRLVPFDVDLPPGARVNYVEKMVGSGLLGGIMLRLPNLGKPGTLIAEVDLPVTRAMLPGSLDLREW